MKKNKVKNSNIDEHWANCILSYRVKDDVACYNAGLELAGGAYDDKGKEVHVWIIKNTKHKTKKVR